MSEDPAEARFIERLLARDERAFNELVELYGDRVYRLVLRMLGRREEAEDMAQEVFVQVFKAIDQFRGDAKLGTWIYRIAVNTCKNRSKYLSRRQSDKEDEFEAIAERQALGDTPALGSSEYAPPDQVVSGYQVEKIVRQCILELDEDFREVLILRDIEDLSYEDIVDITGHPEGTVKSRLHRARAMLKAKVEALLGEKIP